MGKRSGNIFGRAFRTFGVDGNLPMLFGPFLATSANATYDRNFPRANLSGESGGGGFEGFNDFYGMGGGMSLTSGVNALNQQWVAVAQTQQLKVWSIVEENASDLRRRMTRKYQVDF